MASYALSTRIKKPNYQRQNYRMISLLCTGYKVFTTVLINKPETHAEQIIGAYHAGFRKGKSTTDQLFSVKLILEKLEEYKIDVHQIFVDFKQDYDKTDRRKLYKIVIFWNAQKTNMINQSNYGRVSLPS
jgi:hypothetical protein